MMDILRPIKKYLHAIADNTEESILQKLKMQQRSDFLTEKAINSEKKGISNELYCESEVVVTLTSYGHRIKNVYLAIESIMQGSLLPNKIVLWLAEEEKENPLPRTLQAQQKRGLEIYYYKDIKSYKKLIPSLKKYPNSILITIDDDVIYDYNVVENLVNTHNKYPKAICACRVHKVVLGEDFKPLPYWKWKSHGGIKEPSYKNFATGAGGILYPIGSLSKNVLDESVFMSFCPTADDVWFYCMELLNETKTVMVTCNSKNGEDYIEIEDSQLSSLKDKNLTEQNGLCANDLQLSKVLDKYNIHYNEIDG